MPTYIIMTTAIVTRSYRITADTAAEAIDDMQAGNVDPSDNAVETEYISEMYEDRDGELIEVNHETA